MPVLLTFALSHNTSTKTGNASLSLDTESRSGIEVKHYNFQQFNKNKQSTPRLVFYCIKKGVTYQVKSQSRSTTLS